MTLPGFKFFWFLVKSVFDMGRGINRAFQERALFIVTVPAVPFVGDPRLSAEGLLQMQALRKFLPDLPSSCWRGTGKRHSDGTSALGYALDASKRSDAVGIAAQFLKTQDDRWAMLSHTAKSAKDAKDADHLAIARLMGKQRIALEKLLLELQHNAVVVGEAFLLHQLGLDEIFEPKPASVYLVKTRNGFRNNARWSVLAEEGKEV